LAGVVSSALLPTGQELDLGPAGAAPPAVLDACARVTAAVREHKDFLYRLLRRLGVPAVAADDALQRVYVVLARRIDTVAIGCERPYLFGIALRVAKSVRSSLGASHELLDQDVVAAAPARERGADEQLDDCRARALLDGLLESMPLDLRTVFVLYELEELTMQEIATLLEVPSGTVASRLRRAREEFERLSRRLQARLAKEVR
jgi:RNA polymerase sigma-70 factor (ECF subfamily)